jgi:UDP-N-acetylglucosamine 3-dehydrogenase
MAKDEVDSGKIGRVVETYARRNITSTESKPYLQRISPVVEDALHDTDLMLWYSKSKISSVYSDAIYVRGLPNPDIVWTIYRFENNALGVAENTWLLPEKSPFSMDARMEIVGTEGVIHIDLSDGCIHVTDGQGFRMPDTFHWPIMHGLLVGALKEEIAYFVNCLANDNEPTIIRPEEARDALEAALAAEASFKSHQPVKLTH